MERLLLDASQFQRMMEADGPDEALKVLSETNYARGMAEGDWRFDSALEAELCATFDEFTGFVPDRELIDVFRVPYDFHNVKVLMKGGFKARSGGKRRYDLLTRLGSVPVDDLASKMESEEYGWLPYGLSQTIPACMAAWDQNKDAVEVERMLDRCMFASILSIAGRVNEPGVLKWARAKVDSENLRNLLRMKRFGFDASSAAAFLHEGGAIAPSALAPLVSEQFDGWRRVLGYSEAGLAISSVQDEGDFEKLMVALERALDDYCSSVVAKARYSSDSPENVLAYLWGKEMEVKNIRTILVSKGTRADIGEVRGMMRRGYY
jgi:V/A-type H+-transporting ATPase subunit C